MLNFYLRCLVSEIGFVASRIWRHRDFSARGRFRRFFMTDSERVTTTSYKWLMVTFVLTRTDWTLFDIFSLHGIYLLAVKYWGFWGQLPHESVNIEKYLLKGHFLESIRVFWAIVHWNRFTGIGSMRVKEYKNKNNKKGTRPVYFTTTWGRYHWNYLHQTWQGCWNAWPYHSIQISNQLIHKCGFGKWLKFHVLALLRRSPLTLN